MDYLSPASCKETTGWLKSQSMQVKKGLASSKYKKKNLGVNITIDIVN